MAERPRYDQPTVFNFLHDYGCDLRARRVFLHHSMDVAQASHEIGTDYVARNLLHLDKSNDMIELWINSPGGDVGEMWGLIDIMKTGRNSVCTVAYGNVSSAACLLLASGTGTRYTMPNASFMWHAGTTGIDSDMHWPDAESRMRWEKLQTKRWIRAMARCTKPRDDGKQIRTVRGRESYWAHWAEKGGELWMDAKQMVLHGVVDEVWDNE